MSKHISSYELANLYKRSHDLMRNIDGLQPQEAFDELLKFLFFKQVHDYKQNQISTPIIVSPTGYFTNQPEQTAKKIRSLFEQYVKAANSWFNLIWRVPQFHLSDNALAALYDIFQSVNFADLDMDIRSAAIKEFLTPEIRRGLGIYLTPDDVVKLVLDVIDPAPSQKLYDPACGSGTFLIEAIKRWTSNNTQKLEIWGSDKSPKMLLLSELNLGHFSNIHFQRKVFDIFSDFPNSDWPQPNSFDVIVTNPPFGITIRREHVDLSQFISCKSRSGKVKEKQSSEILFIEQALRLLKPGGTLGIILPKSIITNSTFKNERYSLGKLGYVYAIVNLPPETFQSMGTQASTVALFMRKYTERENPNENIKIVASEITNVGFDSTGREREDNQLLDAGKEIYTTVKSGIVTGSLCRLLPEVSKRESLSKLRDILYLSSNNTKVVKLGDIIKLAKVGKTIPRKHYADSGLFILKVGNLTGHGINWQPRERNFVGPKEAEKRYRTPELILEVGDIVLTASAHSPVYIAKKVDIISSIPEHVSGKATFSGEVMLLRPNKAIINPYLLLGYLRSQKARQDIQKMIRGQTAHLYPEDIVNLEIPAVLLEPDQRLEELGNILQRESSLSDMLNVLAEQQKGLIQVLFDETLR